MGLLSDQAPEDKAGCWLCATLRFLKTTQPLKDPIYQPLHCLPLQIPENGLLGLFLGWGMDELLFELVGLVLCLATWVVTGCRLGQGERGLGKGPLVNR